MYVARYGGVRWLGLSVGWYILQVFMEKLTFTVWSGKIIRMSICLFASFSNVLTFWNACTLGFSWILDITMAQPSVIYPTGEYKLANKPKAINRRDTEIFVN
jgi:protein-S-isoprenylcysteine O-methyltransferase Ste14